MYDSIILKSDSYKFSQWNMYPPGTQYVYSYIESRGGDIPETVFFGLQAFIEQYLTKSITQEDIDEAEELVLAHGLPFYREGWEYILDKRSGYLPVHIKAVPEGTVVPNKNVLATIVNTDSNCWWLTSFLETALLRAIWYPTTIASTDRKIKEIILAYLEETGDPSLIDSRYHDFGSRGVSSGESAEIGGCAHLVNFQGTDNIESLVFARKYYDHKMAGFSIPATEHSCVTSWGKKGEVDAYRNIIQKHLKPGTLVSVVSDSWDIFQKLEEIRERANKGFTI